MSAFIVLTTVNVPHLLEGYADNLERYGHKGEAGFIVVADLKTPSEAGELVQRLSRRGFEAIYLSVEEQKRWLKPFPSLEEMVPYNSDNRRNIGYLVAVQRGADIVISIDDDNLVGQEDFLAGHKVIGSREVFPVISSSSGWFNICSMMDTKPPRTIYPRGFPYSHRWDNEAVSASSGSGRVVINAGLWLEDPDVDAVTRLNAEVKTVALNTSRVTLAAGTWSPINTQNTSFHREILPCFYYVAMGFPVKGMTIDRYGDIWAGYLARKVIDGMSDRVAYGYPVTVHKRNRHDLLKDLQQELWGMIFTEDWIKILGSICLTSKDYSSLYLELAGALEQTAKQTGRFTPEMCSILEKVAHNMKVWLDVCSQLM
jgi:hypothetical protein